MCVSVCFFISMSIILANLNKIKCMPDYILFQVVLT